MHDFSAQRTLVKSPPELWSELSEVDRLAKHLEAFGEIKITKLEPEQTVAWEGESASGTVSIEPSGWGTKVTLTARVEEPPEELKPEGVHDETGDIVPERVEPPEPEAPAETEAAPKRGFIARLFRRERAAAPAEQPVWVTGAPEPEAPPEEPEVREEPEPPSPTQAVLESALEALGSAHHRPLSRGWGAGAASGTTRRSFLTASAAAAAGAALGDLDALAARPDGPNLLLVIVDSLRADAVYEKATRTPNIDELMRQGLRFTSVYPEAMPTVPARNSILSGRRTFPFRGWHDYRGLLNVPGWAPLRDLQHSLPATLRRAGYWTAYVTDNPFLGFSAPYGPLRNSVHSFTRVGGELGGGNPVSSVPERVRRHWLHPALDPEKRERIGLYLANSRYWADERRSFAAKVMTHATERLDQAARRRPFALIVDAYEPHEPWTPPRPYVDMYGEWKGPEPSMPRYGRARDWLRPGEREPVLRRLRELYAAEVTMTDRWLGMLLDRLHDLNLERETIVALVADHGILLGEHGWTGKISTALHPALIRVPLVIVDPARRRAGAASDYFASTHDVAPTLLSMLGVRAPERMNGVNLSVLLDRRSPPERPYAFGGYSNSFFIRTRRWALSGSNRGTGFRLFDAVADPGEGENVAGRNSAVVKWLHDTVLARTGGSLPYYG